MMRIDTPRNIRVIITRPPPAPLMEGFDVAGYQQGVRYDVECRLGRYLIDAGYAVSGLRPLPAPPDLALPPAQELRRAEDRIRDQLHDRRARTIGPRRRQ